MKFSLTTFLETLRVLNTKLTGCFLQFFLTEHRNMPLDDALSFVARNFDNYLRVLREPYYPPPAQSVYDAREPMRSYSNASSSTYQHQQPAAGSGSTQLSEKQLSTEEISKMIEKLKKEKEQREQQGKVICVDMATRGQGCLFL